MDRKFLGKAAAGFGTVLVILAVVFLVGRTESERPGTNPTMMPTGQIQNPGNVQEPGNTPQMTSVPTPCNPSPEGRVTPQGGGPSQMPQTTGQAAYVPETTRTASGTAAPAPTGLPVPTEEGGVTPPVPVPTKEGGVTPWLTPETTRGPEVTRGPEATHGPTPAATAGPTHVPSQGTTPVPTGGQPTPAGGRPTVLPDATPVPGTSPTPLPTPCLQNVWDNWKKRGIVNTDSPLEKGTMYYAGWEPLPDGGHLEFYEDVQGDGVYMAGSVFVFGSDAMPEDLLDVPPQSMYGRDMEKDAVRCAFLVPAGRDVRMEFWTDGTVRLAGTGRAWNFPETAPGETELGRAILAASGDYFRYRYTGLVCNVSTEKTAHAGYDEEILARQAEEDRKAYFASLREVIVAPGITDTGTNVCGEDAAGLPYGPLPVSRR